MPRPCSFRLVLLLLSLAVALPSAVGQVSIATLPAGTLAFGGAVNSVTNKIYVPNRNCLAPQCPGPGTVTVIDGATNSTSTVTVGVSPNAIAVNPVTDKIYVANQCGNDVACRSPGTVTVIDGITNNTTTVSTGYSSTYVAVNSVTNKIYVTNTCLLCNGAGTVTVIDGATNDTTTVTVGNFPWELAINSVTDQIYVANKVCEAPPCSTAGTVTVIDGATNNTTTVTAGIMPQPIAVNPVTNQIYVANICGNDPTCQSPATVTVIDGATNNTSTVTIGLRPFDVEVNSVTNQIYTANLCGNDPACQSPGTVTEIDGVSNNTTTINVGFYPYYASVDSATNKIYVANNCGNDPHCASAGTVTVIDGASNNTVPVAVGDEPFGAAVDAATNMIYVPNYADDTVSVIAGDAALQFVSVTPCRLVDTRTANGTFGGPPIQGGTSRGFPIPQQTPCDIPATAAAYSLNVTLVPINGAPVSYLTIWPAGEILRPLVSTMNSLDGRIKANAAIVPAGLSGGVSVYVTNTTNVVIDIDGYFIPSSGSTLAFYTLTPCRVLDTRNPNGPLGGPFLTGGQERDFPVLSSNCQIPSSAQAYSMNFTVVPYNGEPMGYLTVWPQGSSKPEVSTLNNLTATIVANAAIVPAGTGGGIATYADQNTQLVADIDGYFAAPGEGGLSLYPAVPCRAIDTCKIGNGQPFSGTLSPPVDVVDSVCAPPATAQAYVFNATVVPVGILGYLTLWPDSENQPVVSTLNAIDGAITSNMAIVSNIDGKTDAFASGVTQLILDISSYFAP